MTRIILIGAGSEGKALVEFFHRQANVEIVGVADQDERAAGLLLARDLGFPVTTNYQELVATRAVELIVNVSGDPGITRAIHKLKTEGTEVIGGNAGRFIWEFIEGEQNRSPRR